jgi:hypothetical protein
MSKEPIKTKETGGRPSPSDEQFAIWLTEIKPWLELSNSLYAACGKSGLENHYAVILRKYNLNDWFSKKVDAYRASAGEDVSEVFVRLVKKIAERVKAQMVISREEIEILKHFSEKHRTAQPFFVTRFETAEAKDEDIGKILDVIEASNNEIVGREAKKQMVEAEQPVQNQEQTGANSPVSTELPAVEVPSTAPESPVQSDP